jgi:iron complex outermembrane receptor protein
MKKSVLALFAMMVGLVSIAQVEISGVVNDENGEALQGAFIQLENTFLYAVSDGAGEFAFTVAEGGSYVVVVTHLGYELSATQVSIDAGATEEKVSIQLTPKIFTAEEVVVKGTRAGVLVPMAQSTINQDELSEVNLGMDVPELLNTTPSLYFTSDAGNGVGYTYLRLRGSDQTNINVMINGIPLNDAESHGVFWVNMPDITTSTQSIQIQRGVGTSTNGAGAFGGSINILTEGINTQAYGEVSTGYGSFNTSKVNAKLGTGLLKDHWTFDGRLSYIHSDGFIERSAADLNSYYLAGSYSDDKNTLRAITFGGNEVTQQAWWGVPEGRLTGDEQLMLDFAYDNGYTQADIDNLLSSDRSFNYYQYDNEVDDYGQDHYQLHYNRKVGKHNLLHVAGHYTKGKGFFEQFQDKDNWSHDTYFSQYGLQDPIIGLDTISQTDIIRRRWLDNDFFGAIASLNLKGDKTDTWVGGGWNKYIGDHFGEVIWAEFASDSDIRDRYYDNQAKKADANMFAKTTYSLNSDWSLYGDLQFRHIEYEFVGNLQDGTQADQKVTYDFFNPKFGVNYLNSKGVRGFMSFAVGNKEPNRDDHTASTPDSRPRHQTLYDVEAGFSLQGRMLAGEVVLYNMQYTDQLIPTGEINDVGESIRTNIDDSYRRGVELIGRWRPLERLDWSLTLNLSQNKINDYVDLAGLGDNLGQTDIAFSPSVILGDQLSYKILSRDPEDGSGVDLKAVWFTKYVGEQFLDNTSDSRKVIDDFLVNDLRFNLSVGGERFRALEFTFMIRNLLDEQYASNGWTYKYFLGPNPEDEVTFNAYYPQAGRNFMTGLTLKF